MQQHCRQMLALTSIVILLAGSWARGQRPQAPEDVAGTRLAGLAVGPHRVGFSVRAGLDPTRRTSIAERGTKIGIATWYPAQAQADAARVTGLDYRLLEFARSPSDAEKRRYVDGLADTAMGWRHVGIVELTKSQALATFSASGIARRSAPAASGRFPMVLVLGGQYLPEHDGRSSSPHTATWWSPRSASATSPTRSAPISSPGISRTACATASGRSNSCGPAASAIPIGSA